MVRILCQLGVNEASLGPKMIQKVHLNFHKSQEIFNWNHGVDKESKLNNETEN